LQWSAGLQWSRPDHWRRDGHQAAPQARAMAADGARLVVAEINDEAGEQTAQIVGPGGGIASRVAKDVTRKTVSGRRATLAVRSRGDYTSCNNNRRRIDPGWTARGRWGRRGYSACNSRLDLFGRFADAAWHTGNYDSGGDRYHMASNVALRGSPAGMGTPPRRAASPRFHRR